MSEPIEIAPGVVIVDISADMPRHKTRRYATRKAPIVRQYFHHSGRLGKPGRLGALNSARYVVTYRNFPGAAYHFWIPFEEESTEDGELVCFRLQPDAVQCWHTGGAANGNGIGIAFQGNTSINGLSDSQIEIAEALIPWNNERLGIDPRTGLSFHAEADRWGGHSKPSCPGKAAEKWLREYREKAA